LGTPAGRIMFSLRSLALLVASYVVLPRLTFLPPNLHAVLVVFGPFLLPRALDWALAARATRPSLPVQPVPRRVQRALYLLFVGALASLGLSLARFAPANVFLQTRSHVRTETSVLFARLRHVRPLTATDEVLRAKFALSGRNRLLYLAYGPDALLACMWCASAGGDDQQRYFAYSLPAIVVPHLAHLVLIGLVTSSLVAGPESARFRTHAAIAGVLLVVVEAWYMGTYDLTANKAAVSVAQLDCVFWRVRLMRYLAFVAVDLGLALVLWATSTNRWLAQPVSLAQHLEAATKQAEDTLNKLRALGLLTNSVHRDATLRGVREDYWRTEGQVMAEVVQDPAVVEHINSVMSSMDFGALQGRVGQVADGILAGIDSLRTSPGHEEAI